MTEMVKLLQDMIPRSLSGLEAYLDNRELCSVISNCQELYFLEDTATPILQTDASDYGIGGYLYMVTNCKVRVIRFFRKLSQALN